MVGTYNGRQNAAVGHRYDRLGGSVSVLDSHFQEATALTSPSQERTEYVERIHFEALRVLIEDSRMRQFMEKQLGVERFKELFPELFERRQ